MPNPQPVAPAPPPQAQAPVPTQQRLRRLQVAVLKNLRDLDLEFGDEPLAAVMGTNRSGKTTVLHALACAFRPPNPGEVDYRFPSFFKPNTDSRWIGSDFTVSYRHRLGPQVLELAQQYTKAQDRWTPRYRRRPIRSVRFMNIRDSVPEMELLNRTSMIHYQKENANDQIANLVRTTAGQILNCVYDQFHHVDYAFGGKRSIGVTTQGQAYSALSMSSGEQRVFRILDTIFRSPDYSLILIDEIDLFLHQDALHRLLGKLHDHCLAKHKQVIFTTHFPPVAKLYDKVAIATLHRTAARTVVWRGYSYDGLSHITGQQQRPVMVYGEDDVAEAIIGKVANDLGIRRHVQTGRYGPAVNAFALGTGLLLSGQALDNLLIVLDGDRFGEPKERRDQIKKVLTGDQPQHDDQRGALYAKVRSFRPVQTLSPEQMIHRLLQTVQAQGLSPEDQELLAIAQAILNVPEKHAFVDQIIAQTGENRQVGLSKIVSLAARSAGWERFTRVIRLWLESRRDALNLAN